MEIDLLVISFREHCIPNIIRNVNRLKPTNVYVATHINPKMFPKGYRIIKVDKDLRIGKKRNILLIHSRSYVKAFMDDDDLHFDYRLKEQCRYMIENKLTICSPEAALIFNVYNNKCWRETANYDPKDEKARSCIEGCLMFFGHPKSRFLESNILEGYPFVLEQGFGFYNRKDSNGDPCELYILIKHAENVVEKPEPAQSVKNQRLINIVQFLNTNK